MCLPLQQAQAEAEEEFISNTLLKKIHSLKKEKEALAMNYEQEEEFLTNDLTRKLAQVRIIKSRLQLINLLSCEVGWPAASVGHTYYSNS